MMIDQIALKAKNLAIAEAKLEVAKKETRAANTKAEKRLRSEIEWMDKALKSSEDAVKATEDAVTAAEASVAANQDAANARAELKNRKRAEADIPARPYAQPVAASPVIPAWYPSAASMVKKVIRDQALAEHKDNYSSMNYEIERQTKAYEKILRYYNTANPFIKAAINKAALEHGTNYSSFSYAVERQIEAKQKFDEQR